MLGVSGVLLLAQATFGAESNTFSEITATNLPGWMTRPLSLSDALNLTLQQNSTLTKAKADLEASHGVVVQTRAIVIPQIQITGKYISQDPNSIEQFPLPPGSASDLVVPHESWNTGIRIVQSVYEGGRLFAAVRAAKLTREQALADYQTVMADTLVNTRVAYYDVLQNEQEIVVAEASVNLLSRELEDQQRRFDAGTVPRFNVLRAEVAVANERPVLIRARNAYRIAKNNLANFLGCNLPRQIWEDIPLQLTDKLDVTPYNLDLPSAITEALVRRTELQSLRKGEQLREEDIVNARSGYKPSLQAFAGYSWQSPTLMEDLGESFSGWNVGGQLTWNLFDGLSTHGKILQATALRNKARADIDDTSRRIELEVRTAYSTFVEAREVLESQEKVQEEADEALRLARARAEAGTGTQLDVLDAQTSLTQARTTQVEAQHDYAVARARLERAIGLDMVREQGK